jgi:hypothetical protein
MALGKRGEAPEKKRAQASECVLGSDERADWRQCMVMVNQKRKACGVWPTLENFRQAVEPHYLAVTIDSFKKYLYSDCPRDHAILMRAFGIAFHEGDPSKSEDEHVAEIKHRPFGGQPDHSSSSSEPHFGLRIAGLSFVQDKRWRPTTFIQRLVDIVDQLIPDAGDDWRPPRELLVPVYYNYPQTWRLLVNQEDDIVGFWRFAPLTPEQYDRARNRRFLDKELTMDALSLFNLSGVYDVYVTFMGIVPLYNIGFPRLFSSFFSVLDERYREGIYIGSICANALTPLGRKWCDEIGMRPLGQHQRRGHVYEDNMVDILERFESDRAPLLKIFRAIVQRYRKQFRKRGSQSKRRKGEGDTSV